MDRSFKINSYVNSNKASKNVSPTSKTEHKNKFSMRLEEICIDKDRRKTEIDLRSFEN